MLSGHERGKECQLSDEPLMYAWSLAAIPQFHAQAGEAFAPLMAKHKYRLHAQRAEDLEHGQDARASVSYLGERVEVSIEWAFAEAYISVVFIELQVPRVSPKQRSFVDDKLKDAARAISLRALAEQVGHADDPDLPPKQGRRHTTNAQFKRLQSDMRGVLDGLARATERYASDILRGDTSIFPDVRRAYTEKLRAEGYW